MRIDFHELEPNVIHNYCGGEKDTVTRVFADEKNKIIRAVLEPGASIGSHCHETSSEIIYILQGQGCTLYEGERIPLAAGDCHYCPKGKTHSLINDSDADLVFFAVIPQQ